MPNIVTNELRIFNAEQFVESLGETANSKIYLFIGRPQVWSNEASPPTPANTIISDFEIWDDMIAMRRINSDDVNLVIPRKNWVTGTTYNTYSNNANLFSTNFYVMTDQYKVYKCINNNRNGASTVKPTSTATSIFTTADKYQWKYMYSLTDLEVLKFETSDFIAVRTDSTVSAAAIDGGIHYVELINGGSNYYNVANLKVNIVGDGSNANIVANVNTSNVITDFIVYNPGFNYRYANVVIAGGGGSGASARAVISPRGGHGYDNASELGGFYAMVNGRLNYAFGEGDFPVENEYRRIGLIKNPKSRALNADAQELTLNTNYGIKLIDVTGTFTLDEFITGASSKANAFVVTSNIIGTNAFIRYIQANNLTSNANSFIIGDIITGQSSGASGNVSAVILPEAIHDTGKVLYVNNRTAIPRRYDQAENIHIVIEF